MKVAEKKLKQFIGSILKYKEKLTRFKLFGRFLQLYDELNEEDIKMYIEVMQVMFKVVLNFQIQELDEIIYVPIARCLDYLRMTFGSHMTVISMTNSIKTVSKTNLSATASRLFETIGKIPNCLYRYSSNKGKSSSRKYSKKSIPISSPRLMPSSSMPSPSR